MNYNRIGLSGQDRPVLFFFCFLSGKCTGKYDARSRTCGHFSNLCYNRIYADICLPAMDGRSSGLIPEKCP